jgi:gentisate 1,2-dioxygenase
MSTDAISGTHAAPATEFGDEAELGALYRDLAAVDLRPLWTITEQLLTPTPRPAAVPWLWSAATMKPLARRAISLVPVERGGERRVLSLQNPGLGGTPYAVGTLWGALQCLGPREVAPAHRHTPGAIRFVLEGEGVWTTVNGDACDMRPGDLVLTPSMNWHDHTSTADGEMFWFDGLDLPMVAALDGVFFEEYPGPGESQPEPAEHNVSERTHSGGTRYVAGSVTDALSPRHSKLMNYRWADTTAELDRLAETSDDALLQVEYVDPETGASVLPTMACAVHRVRAGRQTPPVRRAGNAIYVVFQGTGSSVIGGQRFDWGPGDMFVVPSWCPVEHQSDEQADLFVVSDEPVLRALGIARAQVLDTPQTVTGTFTAR